MNSHDSGRPAAIMCSACWDVLTSERTTHRHRVIETHRRQKLWLCDACFERWKARFIKVKDDYFAGEWVRREKEVKRGQPC